MAPIIEGAINFRPLDLHVMHATGIDVGDQLRKGNLYMGRLLAREKLSDDCIQKRPKQQQGDDRNYQNKDDPISLQFAINERHHPVLCRRALLQVVSQRPDARGRGSPTIKKLPAAAYLCVMRGLGPRIRILDT
jgi:hypothetical protein